jgi:amino-acid N-acetyltransferase
MNLRVRRATPADVRAIGELLGPYIQRGELLPRDPADIQDSIDHWVVAADRGRIIGCGSLVSYSEELSEVRSLAVAPPYRGLGIGRALMSALVETGRDMGFHRLFALTRAVPFFVQAGFNKIEMTEIPEKVWRDCAPCPLKDRCDEHPVMLILSEEPADRREGLVDRRGEDHYATS